MPPYSLQDGNCTDNSNFGVDFPGIQYDLDTQDQMIFNNEGAQLDTDSSVEDFDFLQLQALGNKGFGLDDVFGFANNNGQHHHSTTRQDGPILQQLIAQCSPPPPYQPLLPQQPTSFVPVQQNVSDVFSQGCHEYIPPNPQTQGQAAKLAPARGNTHGLAFQNLAEAKKAMLSRHLDKDWCAPVEDNTVPTNDEVRAAYVAELLEAMKDTSACSDRRETPALVSRWTPDATNAPHSEHMEKVCWQLVDIAERLHIDGPVSLPIYDKQALATVRKSRFLTFAQRMDHLCALLRLSKSRCFSLLKGENLETTVAAPAQRYSGTVVNCAQNGKRQEFIREGRPVWKDKNGAANEKTLLAPVGAEERLSSETSRNPNISVGMASTGDAHALTGATHHTHIGPINGGAVLFGSVHGNPQQSHFLTGRYEGDLSIGGSSYYHNGTLDPFHALLSQATPMPSMQSPYAPPSIASLETRTAGGFPDVPHLRSCDAQRAAQAQKRTAEEARLQVGPDLPSQRPRFNNQNTTCN